MPTLPPALTRPSSEFPLCLTRRRSHTANAAHLFRDSPHLKCSAYHRFSFAPRHVVTGRRHQMERGKVSLRLQTTAVRRAPRDAWWPNSSTAPLVLRRTPMILFGIGLARAPMVGTSRLIEPGSRRGTDTVKRRTIRKSLGVHEQRLIKDYRRLTIVKSNGWRSREESKRVVIETPNAPSKAVKSKPRRYFPVLNILSLWTLSGFWHNEIALWQASLKISRSRSRTPRPRLRAVTQALHGLQPERSKLTPVELPRHPEVARGGLAAPNSERRQERLEAGALGSTWLLTGTLALGSTCPGAVDAARCRFTPTDCSPCTTASAFHPHQGPNPSWNASRHAVKGHDQTLAPSGTIPPAAPAVSAESKWR